MSVSPTYAILKRAKQGEVMTMAQKNVLKYIILGLLAHRELAGYDIKKLFEEELGDFWYSNHSQIYPELRHMEDDGLISSRTELVGKKLEKKFYQITKSGQQLLSAWMHEPLSQPVPTRDDFTMKLYLLDSAADPLTRQLFQEEIARHEEKYQYLKARWQLLFADEEARQKHFGHRCILQQAILREKQRLDWLRQELKHLPLQ